MIDLVLNNFTTDRSYGREFFEKTVKATAEETSLGDKNVELSINLVGEGRIKALNKKYRGRNRVTDVLSFPLMNKHGPVRTYTSQRLVTSNGVNAIISLGDIFICLPVAKKHAQREGTSLDSKMAFLTVHGFLHLLGYDHEKPEDKKAMFKLQDQILNKVLAAKD